MADEKKETPAPKGKAVYRLKDGKTATQVTVGVLAGVNITNDKLNDPDPRRGERLIRVLKAQKLFDTLVEVVN